MSLPRYKFSEESEEDLLGFFKVVAKHKPAVSNDVDLWKILLPVDKEIYNKIDSFKNASSDEIIEIIESDEEKTEAKSLEKSNQDFRQPPDDEPNLNVTAAEDLIDGVQELLQTESVLSETIIKQIGSEYSSECLQNMFISFAKNLNSECTLKLWKSIISANCVERSIVARYFVEYILIVKVLHEHNDFVTMLFVEVFDEFPNEVVLALSKVLFETNANTNLVIFKSNLDTLSDNHKNTLLSTFKSHCQKLELHHLSIILSLLTSTSSGETLMKIVELMCQVAKKFSSEKSFGKLLLEIIQHLGSNVVRTEQQLKYIISNHKSVFKAKVVKLFDSCLQDHKIFSQSFSM
ncbi:hypothetical protein ILUMI_10258 [Ignelater luminosus]|uniref:Uncharacterized protein n=1 Tax=Ignelater luminosus TaxID=2038154 RepID=A0A8K0D2S5_IGNLU|nr:hypothetical protein ILUMI_10258 [Ignelater luminosus]